MQVTSSDSEGVRMNRPHICAPRSLHRAPTKEVSDAPTKEHYEFPRHTRPECWHPQRYRSLWKRRSAGGASETPRWHLMVAIGRRFGTLRRMSTLYQLATVDERYTAPRYTSRTVYSSIVALRALRGVPPILAPVLQLDVL